MLNSRVQTLLIMATGLFGHKQRLWHIIPVIGRRTAEKNAVFWPKKWSNPAHANMYLCRVGGGII